jgi:pyruvate dehydrogenase E1 component alpha subunit
MYDPDLYRSKREIEHWRARDPIDLFVREAERLSLLDEAARDEIAERVEVEVDDAIAFAEASPWEPVEDLARDVYTPRGVAP